MTERERLIRAIDVGADAEIYGLAWSPDGTRLAVAENGNARAVRVYTAEGRELWQLELSGRGVCRVVWSPDGRWLAVAREHEAVAVVDAASGTQILWSRSGSEFDGRRHSKGIAWSPDSTRVAVGVGSETTGQAVAILLAATGVLEATHQISTTFIWGLVWAPGGNHLVIDTGDTSGAAPVVLDTRAGRVVSRLPLSGCSMYQTLACSPDGSRVAYSAIREGVIAVCLLSTSELEMKLPGMNLYAVAWSPDGRVVAGGADEGRIHLWDPNTARELFAGQAQSTVRALVFAPDGKMLASGGSGALQMWDVSDLCGVPAKAPATWAAGPDGAYLARQLATVGRRPTTTAVPAGLDLWVPTGLPGADPAKGCLGLIAGAAPRTIELFADGRHVFGGVKDTERWARWELATGRKVWEVAGPRANDALEVAASPHDDRVAVVVSGGPSAWGSVEPGSPITSSVSGFAARDVAWSPDGRRRVWAAYGYAGLRLESTAAGGGHVPMEGTEGRGYWNFTDWSTDGRSIAGATSDDLGMVAVWDAATTTRRWLRESARGKAAIRFSPDGRRLAAVAADGRLTIHDTETGDVVDDYPDVGAGQFAFAWSPGGRFLALPVAGRPQLDLRVWDIAAGREATRFEGLSLNEPCVCWAAGGGFLAAGCDDGVRLFDVRHLMTTSASPAAQAAPSAVPVALRPLPAALSAVHRAGPRPPLSAVADALAAVAGRPPAAPGWHAPGAARLAALRFPPAARPALAAVLLADLPPEPDFDPPPTLPPARLRPALAAALAASADAPPGPTPVPPDALARAAARATPGACALIADAGAAACALDPSLPLRLAARARAAPARRRPPAAGLSADAGGAGGAGAASAGGGRAGAARAGPPQAVTPWQWALPPEVLAARARRGELVYRAAPAAPPQPTRPAVVVLDASAAAGGPAGAAMRAAAAAVLRAAAASGGAYLVSAGGGWSGPVRSGADLAGAWAAGGGAGRADAAAALLAAGRARAGLGAGAAVVVVGGPWLGWADAAGAVAAARAAGGAAGARGVFVGPAGWSGRPALAAGLGRWAATAHDRLPPDDHLLHLLLG